MILPGNDLKYFFNVKSKKYPKEFSFSQDLLTFRPTEQNEKYVLGFEVEEEEFGALICKLTIRDNTGVYDKIFSRGQAFLITWGIDPKSSNYTKLFTNPFSDEVTGQYIRGGDEGIECFLIDKNGGFGGGNHFSTLILRSGRYEQRAKETKVFSSGTVGEVIREIASNFLRINIQNLYIDFPEMTTLLTKKNFLTRDNETPIEFLKRLSIKFNCKLVYQFNGSNTVLLFVAWSQEKKYNLSQLRKLNGEFHYFDYGNDQSNILDTPTYNIQGGTLSSSAIPTTDPNTGKATIMFLPSGQDSTQAYVLNQKAIETELRNLSPAAKTAKLGEIMSASFEDFLDEAGNIAQRFKKYFTVRSYTTTPENGGYEVKCPVVPNPLYQIGDRCWLGKKSDRAVSVIPPSLSTFTKNELTKKYYRIAKQTYKHDGGGVSQEVTLKR